MSVRAFEVLECVENRKVGRKHLATDRCGRRRDSLMSSSTIGDITSPSTQHRAVTKFDVPRLASNSLGTSCQRLVRLVDLVSGGRKNL